MQFIKNFFTKLCIVLSAQFFQPEDTMKLRLALFINFSPCPRSTHSGWCTIGKKQELRSRRDLSQNPVSDTHTFNKY